jgi:hypothetical protein
LSRGNLEQQDHISKFRDEKKTKESKIPQPISGTHESCIHARSKNKIFHYFPHTCSISSISSLVRVRKEGLTEGPRFLCKSQYMKRLQRANANAQVLTLTKTILDTKEEDSDKY